MLPSDRGGGAGRNQTEHGGAPEGRFGPNCNCKSAAKQSKKKKKKKKQPVKQTATHKRDKQRERVSVKYFLLGKQACTAHGIGIKRYKNICKHFDSSGLGPRRHGNAGKPSHNAF